MGLNCSNEDLCQPSGTFSNDKDKWALEHTTGYHRIKNCLGQWFPIFILYQLQLRKLAVFCLPLSNGKIVLFSNTEPESLLDYQKQWWWWHTQITSHGECTNSIKNNWKFTLRGSCISEQPLRAGKYWQPGWDMLGECRSCHSGGGWEAVQEESLQTATTNHSWSKQGVTGFGDEWGWKKAEGACGWLWSYWQATGLGAKLKVRNTKWEGGRGHSLRQVSRWEYSGRHFYDYKHPLSKICQIYCTCQWKNDTELLTKERGATFCFLWFLCYLSCLKHKNTCTEGDMLMKPVRPCSTGHWRVVRIVPFCIHFARNWGCVPYCSCLGAKVTISNVTVAWAENCQASHYCTCGHNFD